MRLVHLPSWRAQAWRSTSRARRRVAASDRRPKTSLPGAGGPPRPTLATERSPEADREIGLALARYVPDLLRWARRCGVPPRDAPDVVQSVLVQAWRSWERCERPEVRSAWLFRIVSRAAAQYWRHSARREVIGETASLPEMTDEGPAPDRSLEQEDAIATLEEIGRRTTPERWRVFCAHEIDGVTAAVLSKREGVPLGTIFNWLRLARLDLRAAFVRRRVRGDFAETAARASHATRSRRRVPSRRNTK